MAKTKSDADATKPGVNGESLRAPAEETFAQELAALAAADKYEKPPGWKMSPRAVLTYITGGTVVGTTFSP